jgi:DNA polymerase I-like protein with 3'-5' exonuclease and polymerase domains
MRNDFTVVDFETTTVEFGSPHNPQNDLLMATWINGPDHPRPGEHSVVGSALYLYKLLDDIEDASFVVAHNAKFELGWLDRAGLPLGDHISFCTLIGEKCLAGNRQWRLSLNDCLDRRGMGAKDDVGKLIRMGWDTTSIPTPWLLRYCMQDTRKTRDLFLDQRAELEGEGLLPVAFTRNLLTPVLFDIERHGLHLDKDRVDLVHAYYVAEEERLSIKFAQLTDGVNPKSTQQKRELLFDRLHLQVPRDAQGREMLTDGGEPKTDKAAINRLKLKTNEQKETVETLLALTAVRDGLSKYVSHLKWSADNGEAVTADFTQTVAQTHRLTSRGRSTGIQLQNFQRKFRPCVTARTPGWKIGDGDAAGLEFRVATDLAKDDQGLRDIEDGADVHANTARVVFADRWDETIGPKEGTNDGLRTAAKASTFKPLYGGSSGTKAERAYYDEFKRRYSGIADMQAGWTHEVVKNKELRMASGLKFYWPDCRLQESGYITHTTQIYDYPVQSFATADMAPTATVYLWHFMRKAEMQSFLINIVHDSAVGELHPEETEEWSELLGECFNKIIVWYLKEVYDYEWVCPLETEVALHESWGYKPGWEDQWQTANGALVP